MWGLGCLVAFSGGYSVAVLAKEYGHLDSLVWSMVGFLVVLVIVNRIEWPVRKNGSHKEEIQTKRNCEGQQAMRSWNGVLNPRDFSGLQNSIVGDLSCVNDISNPTGVDHL